MFTKTFTCPNGHRWQDADECKRCPVCGAAAAETIGNGDPEKGSTQTGQSVSDAESTQVIQQSKTTYRLQSQRSIDLDAHRRRKLVRSARRSARQALSVARNFKTDLPHALRESGLISAIQGSHRRARKYLDESLAVAQQQGARFEHAQTLLARGTLGLKLDWPEAAEEVAAARQALSELGADFALAHVEMPEQV